ncbi:hypothetical protein [Bacillus sp. OAE603]|uniref:hypothetical protein n=1 Tax=Gottfriedia sp. OAE603 TaxID=2663872 RepID=UPI00178B64D5
MKRIFPIWLALSFLIGVYGIFKTYTIVSPETDFPLFMDGSLIIFFVPSISLVMSTLILILFKLIKSKLVFVSLSLVIVLAVAIYSFLFFRGIYGTVGILILDSEFILLITLHFYISTIPKLLNLKNIEKI